MANLQLSIDTNAMTLSIERLAGPLGLIKAASEDSEMALRFATPLSDLSEALVAAGLISRVEGTAGALKLVPTPAFAAFDTPMIVGRTAASAAKEAVQVGMASRLLMDAGEAVREAVIADLTTVYEAHMTPGGVELPAHCWVVTASA